MQQPTKIVRVGAGARFAGPDGEFGPRFGASSWQRNARHHGFSAEQIASAPVPEVVIGDPLVGVTTFHPPTLTLVEAPEDLERREFLRTPWYLRQGLEDPRNRIFDYLFIRHGNDVFADQRAPWIIHDLGLYWPVLEGPAVDADGKRHLRLVSKGAYITITRKGKPSRRFISLDLQRIWSLAEAYERENPAAMERWRKHGPDHWARLGRRCG